MVGTYRGKKVASEERQRLEDVSEVYDLVAKELRRFRGAMSPTAAGLELAAQTEGEGATLLEEVRAIRHLLEQR